MPKREFVPHERVLLVINDVTVHGKSRLQKYGFLLARQHGKELGVIAKKEPFLQWYDDWESGWHGPFSKALAYDVGRCMEYRLVRREKDDEGFSNKYQYGLALKGRAKWRRMAEVFPKEVGGIGGKVRDLQGIGEESFLFGMYASYSKWMRPAGKVWGD